MIEINLLPPEHRPVERTPMPRLLTILVGVLLTMFGVVFWSWLFFIRIPDAVTQRNESKEKERALKRQADEVIALEQEIKLFQQREETLRKLYKTRVRWTRVLDRIAEARKTGGEVVITALEIKKGTSGGRGRRGPPSRVLDVKGFVPSYASDPVAAQLSRPYYAFVKALQADKKWQEIFDGDPEYKVIKMNYFSKSGSDSKKKDMPKAGLEFNVAFTFKSNDPAPKPRARPKTSVAKKQ